MLTRSVPLFVLTCLAGCLLTSWASAADVNRRYLALDQSLHGELRDMDLVLGKSSLTRAIPAFDEPWEIEHGLVHGIIANVFKDHEGVYRMYYRERSLGALALAVSRDGIHWERKRLNIARRTLDHPHANFIHVPPHQEMRNGRYAGTVFFDPQAPSSERYKLVWTLPNATYAAVSADGLHFGESVRIFEHRNEHLVSAFFDTRKNKYVMYGRIRGARSWIMHNGEEGFDEQRRGAAMHMSTGFLDQPWEDVGITMLDPEKIWDYPNITIRPDFYNPAVIPYHGQYIALPCTYYRDETRVAPDRPDRPTGTGPQYPTLAHSLDGVNFTLADLSLVDAHSPLDLTPHLRINPRPDGTNTTDPEVGQIHAVPAALEIGDAMLLYYFTRSDTHYEEYDDQVYGYWVTRMRVDGWASLNACEGSTGEWRTTPITVPRDAVALHVNASVRGALRVQVLDADGQTIEGLSLSDAQPWRGDAVAAPMHWRQGELAQVAGRTIQLRFAIEDGAIYSFHFVVRP